VSDPLVSTEVPELTRAPRLPREENPDGERAALLLLSLRQANAAWGEARLGVLRTRVRDPAHLWRSWNQARLRLNTGPSASETDRQVTVKQDSGGTTRSILLV
jgi:hypothetical protein